MSEYVEDARGNRCYVSYFGLIEAAQTALESLMNCRNCVNCSDCSRCSRCSGCSDVKNEPLPVPAIPDIHRVVYETASAPGSLQMDKWHTCENTHCRAGWVVTLAGEAGKKIEQFHNTELAAMLIYKASGYKINPARFYDSNDVALADMERLAND